MRNARAAVDRPSAHAAAMKSTAATEPTSAATAGVCIVRNKADRDENQSSQKSEKASKHGIPPLLAGVP
ncbi:hypothetical protein LRP30_36930 [Bradyrhizobium sp. C-145]|uniref:hypothetical protein n=1 Tax=Bradyrhizobium sp. C-145 TaxID=574727 RepID=UPI00201B963F|nr:hypothetical protein [Bradyrhizobium sp. C-145]UQR62301.1 hypothetical protein LRP30_36930 [Bradyrhizobium sp. C-145]